MSTLRKLSEKLGAAINMSSNDLAYLYTEGLMVPVVIKDLREVWGRMDFLVSPVGGSGEKWVSAERVTRANKG